MKASAIRSIGRHLVCLGVALGLSATAFGTSYNWNSTSSGNWNDTTATGWNTGGAYPNAQGDSATFSQNLGANPTITINVGDAKVGTLTLTDTSPGNGWTLAGSNPLTFDIAAGSATLNATGSSVMPYNITPHTISAPIAGSVPLTLNLGANGGLVISNNNSSLTGGITVNGNGAQQAWVRFDSAASLGGSGNTVTVAAGAHAALAFSGTTLTDLARFANSAGLVSFGNPNGLGTIYNPPANINLTGYNEYFRLGAFDLNFGGGGSTVSGTFTPPSNTFRFGGANGKLVVDSVLADGATARAIEVSGSELMMWARPAQVALTRANTYTGVTEVREGILRLAGTNGSALNASAFNIRYGGWLQLDAGLNIWGWNNESGAVVGNNNNRIADSTAVNLYGGKLNFFGNPDTGTTETIGALNVNSGLGVIDARWKTGAITYDTTGNVMNDRGGAGTGAAVLTAQSLNLNNGAQLWVRGVNLGVAGSSATRVMLNTAPTQVGGGGGGGSTTISILPGVFKTTTLATSQNSGSQNWVTYDGTVGLREITSGAGEYSTLVVGENSDNNAVYQQAGAGSTLNVSSATTVNSLKLQFDLTTGDMTISGTGPLTLKSGNLLVEGNPVNDGRNLILSVPLDFNGRAGNVFYVTDTFTGYQLNSPMSNTGGNGVSFSAFNTGSYMPEVPIRGNNTYTGPTSFNAGYWRLEGADERLPDASDLRVRAGARLTVGSGRTETVASLTGAGTVMLESSTSKLVLGGGGGGGGAVTLGTGAFLAPGDSAGALTITNANLTITSGTLAIELETLQATDLLRVANGNVTISGGTLSLSLLPSFVPDLAGNQIKIIDVVDGSKTLTGNFAPANITASPAGYTAYGRDVLFSTFASGNDLFLQVTVVPEPAAVLLLALGGLLVRRRLRAEGRGPKGEGRRPKAEG